VQQEIKKRPAAELWTETSIWSFPMTREEWQGINPLGGRVRASLIAALYFGAANGVATAL
jgi:hypothetical protein